tara:strand:+ start:90 stop:770 length:681 start_codon:yes stop_codon:yes gene_type:complete
MITKQLIKNFIDQEEIDKILDYVNNTPGRDAKESAGEHIKHKKQSTVFGKDHSAIFWTNERLTKLVDTSDITWVNIMPLHTGFIEYNKGDFYDTHFDSPFMTFAAEDPVYSQTARTDLSFTVALNDDYEGGELVIDGEVLTLAKGDLCIYSSGLPHSVNKITKGKRNVIIGWLASPISDPVSRTILHKLHKLQAKACVEAKDSVEKDLYATELQSIYYALLRILSN